MKPKLIALDLDETLLDLESRLTTGNDAALRRAIQQGVEIAVATGRANDTIPEEIRRYPGIRYAITGNGAAVYALKTGQALFRQTLNPHAAQEILDRMEGLDVSYEIFVNGAAYAQEDYLRQLDQYMMDDHRQRYVRSTRRPVPDIRAFLLEHRQTLDSVAVIPRNLEVRQQVLERMSRMEGVYVTTSNIRLVEINHKNCTKAAGLKYLAGILGIDQKDTAAFGNGDNDAEMLRWAGCGVSVAEGTACCRAAADYVAGSYLQDAVAEAVQEIFGI